MVYDARGLKTSHTDPLNNVTTYAYDANDRLASVTDANLHTTSYQYDERGLLTQVTNPDQSTRLYTYDSYGNRLTETDELGHTTTRTYDEFKRVTGVTDPLNRVTLYDYTLPGQSCGCDHADNHPTMITLPSGKKTFMTYDTEWQLTSRTVAYGTVDTATTGYAYDAAGNVTDVTDPNGKTWNQTYDSRDRRNSVTDPLGNTTQWTYDAAGNVMTITRPDSGVTTNTYDSMDRLFTSTNPKNETTSYAYDNGDNLVTLTDARNHAYHFEHDLLNRRTRFIYPDSSFERYDYDGVGNLTLYTARNGIICTRVFDSRNRETSSNWSDSTPDITKTYDVAGRLLTAGNGVSASTYTYDNAHQLMSETQTPAGVGASLTVGYTYDADGNRETLIYPDGMVVAYTYTHRNEVASITADGPPPVAAYGYDTNGNRISKALENGTSTTYTYDDANRLLGISHSVTMNAQPSTLGLAYTYNAMSNRQTRSETVGTTPSVTQIYGYDPIDQIISVNYGMGRSETFAYDSVGNRTIVSDSATGTTTYSVNALNQYTAVSATNLSYDLNGNLTASAGWTYSYDTENRLTTAGASASFTYDWRRRQVSRTINGTTTWFIYDDWNLVAEYSSTAGLQAKYIHGSVVDEILAKVEDSGAVYYHQDALDSTVALTDSAGAVVERYTYDVFGAATTHDAGGSVIARSVHGNRFLFTGREWIAEAGLYDYRNRVYSSHWGRFLQTDPIQFDGDDVNLYRYVANNSTNWIDPLGKIPIVIPAGLAIGEAIGSALVAAGIVDALYNYFNPPAVPYIPPDIDCSAGGGERNWQGDSPNPDKTGRRIRHPQTGKQKRPAPKPEPESEPAPKPPYNPTGDPNNPYPGPPKDGGPAPIRSK